MYTSTPPASNNLFFFGGVGGFDIESQIGPLCWMWIKTVQHELERGALHGCGS